MKDLRDLPDSEFTEIIETSCDDLLDLAYLLNQIALFPEESLEIDGQEPTVH